MDRYTRISEVLADLKGMSAADQGFPMPCPPYPFPAAQGPRPHVSLCFTDCESDGDLLDVISSASRVHHATGKSLSLDFTRCRFGMHEEERSSCRSVQGSPPSDARRHSSDLEDVIFPRLKRAFECVRHGLCEADCDSFLSEMDNLMATMRQLLEPARTEYLSFSEGIRAMALSKRAWDRGDYHTALHYAECMRSLQPDSKGVRLMIDSCRGMLGLG